MDIPDIAWENSGLCFDDHLSIIVPETECPLTDGQMTALRDAVNPRAASQSFGCNTYSTLLLFNFVSSFLVCERTDQRIRVVLVLNCYILIAFARERKIIVTLQK